MKDKLNAAVKANFRKCLKNAYSVDKSCKLIEHAIGQRPSLSPLNFTNIQPFSHSYQRVTQLMRHVTLK